MLPKLYKKLIVNLSLMTIIPVLATNVFANESLIKDRYIVVLKKHEFSHADNSLTAAGENVDEISDRVIKDVERQRLSKAQSTPKKLQTSHLRNKRVHVYKHALKGFSAELTSDALEALKNDPMVDHIEPDLAITADGYQSPAPSWGLDRIDQASLPLDNAYNYKRDGSGVHAYVIDSGIRTTHEEFTGRIGKGITIFDPQLSIEDCTGHGTHVAGILGGSTYGVAKNVILHPVKVFRCDGQSTLTDVLAAIDWVKSNRIQPSVANMSLSTDAVSIALNAAVQDLIATGTTVVVAAGNGGGKDSCLYSPASATNAITVAASTKADNREINSNGGACVDLFAPGSLITSAAYESDNSYGVMSRTSVATPHVAGVVALLLEEAPTVTPALVSDAILRGATKNKINDALTANNSLLNALAPTLNACILSGLGGKYVTTGYGQSTPSAANQAASYCGTCGIYGVTLSGGGTAFYCKQPGVASSSSSSVSTSSSRSSASISSCVASGRSGAYYGTAYSSGIPSAAQAAGTFCGSCGSKSITVANGGVAFYCN
ncbi:MAG: S8 family peptidase [Pseudomonadota bacterium]